MAKDNDQSSRDTLESIQVSPKRPHENVPPKSNNTTRVPNGLPAIAQDGVDNSDLRMLQALAIKKADKDE